MTQNNINKGKIKWYNPEKGYGFIVPDDAGKDVFIHRSEVESAGIRNLSENQSIEYDVLTKQGKTAATNIKLIK